MIGLDQTAGLAELEWPAEAGVRFDPALRSAPPKASCPASLLPAETNGGDDE